MNYNFSFLWYNPFGNQGTFRVKGELRMGKQAVNILNGQSMYNHFKRCNMMTNGIYIPFNEAMCVGDVSEQIFSDDFLNKRCDIHKVSRDQYQEITLNNLTPLLNLNFDKIILWFDDDMFCQINLLTLLAYLDQVSFEGDVTFNLVGKHFELLNTYPIQVEGYYKMYIDVMINKKQVTNIPLNTLKEGIKLYLELTQKENEITTYIKNHEQDDINTLVTKLINQFSNYGLGDTQYMAMINEIRS